MNLATIIDRHPGADVALVCGPQVTTYDALRRQVADLRRGYAHLGVGPGDRVAIVSANSGALVLSYLAVLGLGAVAVPLDPATPGPQMARQVALTTPRVVLVGPGAPGPTGIADLRAIAGPAELVAAEGVTQPGASPWPELGHDGPPPPVAERAPGDPAALLHTAGTGGGVKLAVLTHGSLLANLVQLQRHPGRALRSTDMVLGVLPMWHALGLNVVVGLGLYAGAAILVCESAEPMSALRTAVDGRATVLAAVPAMYEAWARLPEGTGLPAGLDGVRGAVAGGAPLPPRVAAAFERRFGLAVHQGYGVTEASPVVTSSVLTEPPRPGSVGTPLPGVELRLVGAHGDDVLSGDPGEVWVRGPNVCAGYWCEGGVNGPAADEEGWLRTGDVGLSGDDGELYLVDRVGDTVAVGGFDVHPAEVEAVMLEHPAVAEAAAAGFEHPYSGQVVHAWVVVADGVGASEAELIEHCARHLARYKCPTAISFVRALPRGPSGMVVRRALPTPPPG